MGETGPALGLDYGTRRIGVAVSDEEGQFAFPAGVIERRSLAEDLAAIRQIAEQRGIRHVVLGLPLHMDGRAGDMAAAVRAFKEQLQAATGLPVELQDERWTSAEAERAIRDAGGRKGRGRRGRAKGDVDAVAASILLRTWLERRRALAGGDAA
jgi:putative Holliday junction resolvase